MITLQEIFRASTYYKTRHNFSRGGKGQVEMKKRVHFQQEKRCAEEK